MSLSSFFLLGGPLDTESCPSIVVIDTVVPKTSVAYLKLLRFYGPYLQ